MNPNFYQLSNINSNEDSEEDEENYDDQTSELNDNNEEFVEFKNNVKEWLTLDDDIITLQKDMPEIFDDIHKYIMVKNIYDVINIIFVDYETKKHFFNKIL